MSIWRTTWSPLVFLAAVQAGSFGCTGQHANGAVEVMSDDCVTCHGGEFATVVDPPHVGNFPSTCGSCHTNTAWSPAVFSHNGLSSPCFDCHGADYAGAADPPHPQNLPTTCNDCHTTDAWTPAMFSHDGLTAACVGCHQADYDGVADPPHPQHLPTTCENCHTTDVWVPATFTHDGVMGACLGCHQADYEGTQNPPHLNMYPQTCQDCHTTDAWVPALDGIHPEANFPITQEPHSKFACLECHNAALGSSIGGVNTDCVGCHTGDHNATKMNDVHKDQVDYVFDPDNPHFCLECHPRGFRL